jgi:GT2 family glycosyltransferase
MQSIDYQIIPPGLAAELNMLLLPEVLEHLDNHLGNFLLDPAVTIVYLNRIVADSGFNKNNKAIDTSKYLALKLLKLEPFDLGALQLCGNVFNSSEYQALFEYITVQNANNKWEEKIDSLLRNGGTELAIELLQKMLPFSQKNLRLADKLLSLLLRQGIVPEHQFDRFKVAPPFALAWKRRLFLAHAALNAVSQALELWETIKADARDEIALNFAAEVLHKAGDTPAAIKLYGASLALDPRQAPVRRRLAELANPSPCDTALLAARKLNIFLYSYNKAGPLQRTLKSLAGCDLGGARISVLLNGCTDDSQVVVEQAKSLFPNNAFQTICLPINIGAPAARNWLIALPETLEADYTVFLDDDVTVQRDFLHQYLNVAEARDKVGVVGCKVVFPGEKTKYQYLYRNVAVAKDGLLRISLDTPNTQFDNGLYDFTRETANVMGCCHMFPRQALLDVPAFDLCFSPSQMDDIAHDLDLALLGYKVMYCGLVSCIHWQMTGNTRKVSFDARRYGNIAGNDVKFYYRYRGKFQKLRALGSEPAVGQA